MVYFHKTTLYLYSFFHTFKFVIKKISIGNEFFLKICYAFILLNLNLLQFTSKIGIKNTDEYYE